jgi:hypothetical protein
VIKPPPPLGDREVGLGLPPYDFGCEGCGAGLWFGGAHRFEDSDPVYCSTCYQRLWREKQRKRQLVHDHVTPATSSCSA